MIFNKIIQWNQFYLLIKPQRWTKERYVVPTVVEIMPHKVIYHVNDKLLTVPFISK